MYSDTCKSQCEALHALSAGVPAARQGTDEGHRLQSVLDAHPADQQPPACSRGPPGCAEAGHEP
jgi:hypothetical protein